MVDYPPTTPPPTASTPPAAPAAPSLSLKDDCPLFRHLHMIKTTIAKAYFLASLTSSNHFSFVETKCEFFASITTKIKRK